MAKRVVLAYSGGLDTSVAVRWMREEWGFEVVACAVDVGQLAPGEEEEMIRERAAAAGAVETEIIDAREEFARGFLVPALRANALYEGKYPLVSALSRPVIVEHLVASARRHGADAVGHGCTGKGNDQVRFEVSSRILAPDLDVMAPVRVWGLSAPTASSSPTSGRSRSRRRRRSSTRSTRTCGDARSSAACSRTRGRPRPRSRSR